MKDDLYLLDTNVLVYAFDTTAGKKHEIARELLEDCFRGGNFAVCIQNLAEFFVVTTKKIENPISKKEAEEVIKLIVDFKHFKKIHATENTLVNATKLKIHFWDAMIVSTMQEHTIRHIYTENIKDFDITGIKAVNPFS